MEKILFSSCVKRKISILLIFAMIFSTNSMYTFAQEVRKATDSALDKNLMEFDVPAERLGEEMLPEDTKDVIYFGTAQFNCNDGDAIYKTKIFREGNLDSEVSVDVRTFDVTAVYGKHYKIMEDDYKIDVTSNGKSLMKQQVEDKTVDKLEEYDIDGTESTKDDSNTYDEEKGNEVGIEYLSSVESKNENVDEKVSTNDNDDTVYYSEEPEGDVEISGFVNTEEETIADVTEEENIDTTEETTTEETITEETTIEETTTEKTTVETTTEGATIVETEETTIEETESTTIETTLPEMVDEENNEIVASESDIENDDNIFPKDGEYVGTFSEIDEYNLLNGVLGDIEGTNLNDIDYGSSSCFTVTFKKGESEKEIRIRTYRDESETGDLSFGLMILNPQGGINVCQPNTLTVYIQDQEETTTPKITFTKTKYYANDGKIVATIKRTGASYTFVDMELKTAGDTALAGVNYKEINEVICLKPYETEKNIEIAVEGNGEFNLILEEFRGCEAGKTTMARMITSDTLNGKVDTVLTNAKNLFFGSTNASSMLFGEAERFFTIRIDNKNYDVVYKGNNPEIGTIKDKSFNPPVPVGEYYFAKSFNQFQLFGDSATYDEHKYYSSNLPQNSYAYLEWYNWRTWRTGRNTATSYLKIPSTYYQYYIPDWEGMSSFGGGQRFDLTLVDSKANSNGFLASILNRNRWEKREGNGRFARILDQSVKIKYDQSKMRNVLYKPRVEAFDDKKHRTPKNYLKFYGLVCMYKKITATLADPPELTYRTKAGTTNSRPMNVSFGSGVKTGAALSIPTVNLYTSTDKKLSNLVIATNMLELNGKHEKFAKIVGYDIKINPALATEKQFNFHYPDNFISFLRSKIGKDNDGHINYSQNAVESEIRMIKDNLLMIPYDDYFLDYIETSCNQSYIAPGYNIEYSPVFDYVDVKVHVAPPRTGQGNGTFIDSSIDTIGDKIFHAGDQLNMATSPSSGFLSDGYEVSTDGFLYATHIRGTEEALTLMPNKEYWIRPCFKSEDNYIEIKLEGEAKDNLEISPTLNSLEKSALSISDDRIIYKVKEYNSSMPISEIANPVVGMAYTVRAILKNPTLINDPDYEYRPVFRKGNDSTRYNAISFPFLASSEKEQNIITIGLEKVPKSEIRDVKLRGTVTYKNIPIRNNAIEPKPLPISGYTVTMATSIEKPFGASQYFPKTVDVESDNDGVWKNVTIRARTGDIVPYLVTNGITDGNVGKIKIEGDSDSSSYDQFDYPYTAPKVVSVTYKYQNELNNTMMDPLKNNIAVKDDFFYFNFHVNQATPAQIEKAICIVKTPLGNVTEYPATQTIEDPNTYSVKLPNMIQNFHNGDRIFVKLVDKEKYQIDIPGKSPIIKDKIYPIQDTGMIFDIENTPIVEQEISFAQLEADRVELPMIGAPSANTEGTSGVITWNRKDIRDPRTGRVNAYYITLNFGFSKDGKQKPEGAISDDVDRFNYAMKNIKERYGIDDVKRQKEGITAEKINNRVINGDEDLSIDAIRDDESVVDICVASDVNDENRNALGNKPEYSKFNSSSWNVGLIFLVTLTYIYNPEKREFFYARGALSIGVSGEYEFTKYKAIVGIPCFINLGIGAQVDLMFDWTTKKGEQELSAGTFNKTQGNVAETLMRGKSTGFSFGISGKLSVGPGICGFLSARGCIDLKLKFLISNAKSTASSPKYPNGVLIEHSGGIAIDAVVTKININFVHIKKGWGAYNNVSEFEFFGNLVNPTRRNTFGSSDDSYEKENIEVLKVYKNGEIHTTSSPKAGSSDMSKFGESIDELLFTAPMTQKYVDTQILFNNCAEYTRHEYVVCDDGRAFLTFIGKGTNRDAYNYETLYYTIFDGTNWTTPAVVRPNDKTFDSSPALFKRKDPSTGHEVVDIVWLDAMEKFRANESDKDRIKKLGVSYFTYDMSTNVMSRNYQAVDVSEEYETGKHAYLNPIAFNNPTTGKTLMMYEDYDLTNMNTIEDLNNRNIVPVTINLSEINADDSLGTTIELLKEEGTILDVDYEDYELVHDATITTTPPLEDRSFVLLASTIVGNGDLSSKEDVGLYFTIIDKNKSFTGATGPAYYSMRLTKYGESVSNPKIFADDDGVFITYISDGSKFALIDMTDYINTLFNSKYTPIYDNETNRSSTSWYRKSASELGMSTNEEDESLYPVGDHEESTIYQGSINENLFNENFGAIYSTVGTDTDYIANIQSYDIVSDGKDIYLVYSDDPHGESIIKDGSKEIFITRFCNSNDSDASGMDTGNKKISFTEPMQVTNTGDYIDSISGIYRLDGKIGVIAKQQHIIVDPNTGVHSEPYSDKLIGLVIEPRSYLEIENNHVKANAVVVSTDSNIQTLTFDYDIINSGINKTNGFKTWITKVNGGTESAPIFEYTYEATAATSSDTEYMIDAGEISNIHAVYENDYSNLPGKYKVYVENLAIPENQTSTEVNVKANNFVDFDRLVFAESSTGINDVEVSSTITNKGLATMPSQTYKLCRIDADNEVLEQYNTVTVPSLAPGKTYDINSTFTISKEDYNDFGYMELRLVNDDEKFDTCTPNYYIPENPEFTYINDGATSIDITVGGSSQLVAKLYPYNEVIANTVYLVDNPNVVAVSETGVVTGIGAGSTVVTLIYPDLGLSDDIIVNVTDTSTPTKRRHYSGGGGGGGGGGTLSRGTPLLPKDLDDIAVKTGNPNSWLYDQLSDKWYRIGPEGKSIIGWIQELNGSWYFLGYGYSMQEGYNYVNGKWYYFAQSDNEKPGMQRGQLYMNCVTPDGRYAGADGSLSEKPAS